MTYNTSSVEFAFLFTYPHPEISSFLTILKTKKIEKKQKNKRKVDQAKLAPQGSTNQNQPKVSIHYRYNSLRLDKHFYSLSLSSQLKDA